MDATTRFETQRVGALPVIVAYLEKMHLAWIINESVPWEGEVPLGILVEIMVCYRLLNPKAQYKIGEWAERAGVCDYYRIPAEKLNDDLLGRALERVAKHAFTVQSQLVLHLVKGFKLTVINIHYDISNVELYGAYERQLKENAETERERGSTSQTRGAGNGEYLGAGCCDWGRRTGASTDVRANQKWPEECQASAVWHQCHSRWRSSHRLAPF